MKIATLKKIAEKRAIKLVYSRTCDLYFAYDPAYTAGVKAGKMFDKATLENMSAEEFDTVVLSPLFPVVETVAPAEPIAAQPAVAPGEPLAVMALAGRINRECLDWLEIPGTDGELMLVAMPHGVVTMFTDMNGYATPEECYSAAPHLHRIVAPSWNAYVVDLTKRAAPECVAVLHAVMYEPNAEVMARAVEVVRNRRLTAEYLAARNDEPAMLDAGMSGNEQVRALAHEQARADAARKLSGVPSLVLAGGPSFGALMLAAHAHELRERDPMATEHCETCGCALESGQIGDCESCEEENATEFENHYTCYSCGHDWVDVWTAMCDDDCPECGARHCSPHTSEEVKA